MIFVPIKPTIFSFKIFFVTFVTYPVLPKLVKESTYPSFISHELPTRRRQEIVIRGR